MKHLFKFVQAFALLFLFPLFSSAQSHYYQPCHGQDTSAQYRVLFDGKPQSVSLSESERAAVTVFTNAFTNKLYYWRNNHRMMMGLLASDSMDLVSISKAYFDGNNNLFVVSATTIVGDTSIRIFDTGLHLVGVLLNSSGSSTSWNGVKDIAFDASNNLYVLTTDSMSGSTTITGTQKLVKVTSPISAPGYSLLRGGLLHSNSIAMRGNDLYITSSASPNNIIRYNATSLAAVDSIACDTTVFQKMYTTGCKLYASDYTGNSAWVFDAHNLAAGAERKLNIHALSGALTRFIDLDEDLNLFTCTGNSVYYFSDSEQNDTDEISVVRAYSRCLDTSFNFRAAPAGGHWYTADTSIIFLAADHLYDSVAHVFGVRAGTYSIMYVAGTDTTRFSGTIGASHIFHSIRLTDSVAGGSWSVAATSLLYLRASSSDTVVDVFSTGVAYDSVIYLAGAHRAVYYIDFYTSGASTAPGPIYTVNNTSNIYGSTHICANKIAQMFDDIPGGIWSLNSDSIAVIDEVDGAVFPLSAGTVIVSYTVVAPCSGVPTTVTFTLTFDSVINIGTVRGNPNLCQGMVDTLYLDRPSTEVYSSAPTFASYLGDASPTQKLISGLRGGNALITINYHNTCADSVLFFSVNVIDTPAITPVSIPSGFCTDAYGTVVFQGSSSITWTTSSGTFSHSEAMLSPGLYRGNFHVTASDTVFLTATVSNSCGSATLRLRLNHVAHVIDTITGDSTVCVGSTMTFSVADDSATYSLSNTRVLTTGFTSLGRFLTYAARPGIDTVFVHASSSCVSYYPYNFKIVTVIDTPHAGTITATDTICIGTSTTIATTGSGGVYSLSNTNGYFTSSSSIFNATNIGFDSIFYVVDNYCGVDTAYKVINISPRVRSSAISGPASLCVGRPVQYADSFSGMWMLTNTNATFLGVDTVVGIRAGRDTLLHIVTGSCNSDTSRLPVTVYPIPVSGTVHGDSILCIGVSTTFTDTTTGGYWRLSDSTIAHISSGGVVTSLARGSDTVFYIVSNYCGTAVSSAVVNIYPTATASVTITSSLGDTLCTGDTTTLAAHPVNGGTHPRYHWYKNGTFVDTVASFRFNPALSDRINCIMESSLQCSSPDSAFSDTLDFVVLPRVTPTDSITSSTDSVSYFGQVVTFYSDISYCTAPATYQWYLNGTPVAGATSVTYSATVYTDDTVYCVIHCTTRCATSNRDTSNIKIIRADYLGVSNLNVHNGGASLSIFPNPTSGTCTLTGEFEEGNDEAVSITVNDITGRKMYHTIAQLNRGKLEVALSFSKAEFAPGVYIIYVAKGQQLIPLHFVVE